ncbi:ribonuclease H-like domain-containing protein [Suillus lakei]|nr:ribonuclease H-like domain-containing protein [Suillus lakei]
MITTAKREVHTVRVVDVSSERTTANHLKALVLSVMKDVEGNWKATVVAITSDASGESRAARKRLVDEFPWLVAPDCFAHQINLVVGDYYKVPSTSLFIQDIQKALNLANPSQTQRVLGVIRAVLTRWTAHYLAFRRLLDLRATLDILVRQERERGNDARIVTGDAASRQKARRMLELIEDPFMWHVLARMLTHIGPLALAVNFAQAAHCRLDEVLIILGYLISKYLGLLETTTSPDDQIGLRAIIDSLEKRWSKCDQTVFIAAVILNPLYKAKPFAQIRQFTTAGITSLLLKLWQRFQSSPVPESLRKEILDYLQDRGDYECFSEWAEGERNAAETQQRERPDPLRMYEGIRFPDKPLSPLQMLAQRIFSICANSASCKRLFSLFGLILTKLRSRLALEKMLDLAELRLHLRDEYMRRGSVKDRLRRPRHIIPNPLPPQNKDPTTTASSDEITPEITPETSRFDSDSDENSLTSIAEALGQRSELDDAEDPAATFTSIFEQIQLQQLFNFSDDTWTKLMERIGMRSLDDELEFYELVELDAEGEADDQTFDDMMSSTVS